LFFFGGFFGTIRGVLRVALFIKPIGGKAILMAGIVGQLVVFFCHYLNTVEVISLGYLWYNVIGSVTVVAMALAFHFWFRKDVVYG
jgi:hypothetical protein